MRPGRTGSKMPKPIASSSSTRRTIGTARWTALMKPRLSRLPFAFNGGRLGIVLGHCRKDAVLKKQLHAGAAALAIGTAALAAPPVLAPPPTLGPDVQPFVHIPAGRIAIQHLRIIDGTGAAPIEDATLLIDGARIGAVR